MEKPKTVMDYIKTAGAYLERCGCESPRLDAELLLAHVLCTNRTRLYMEFDKPLTAEEVDGYREVIAKRARRVPAAQIMGQREFLSRPFGVTDAVLIPRPETELVVEAALELLGEQAQPAVLDVGTGSGIIAVSIACQRPDARVKAVDVSSAALSVALANAQRSGAAVDFVESDLYAALEEGERFHCIVSNPPYIPSQQLESLQPEIRHEPVLALDGGPDGLRFYRRLINQAADFLHPSGYLVLEIGWDQADAVLALIEQSQLQRSEVRKDYGGLDRVVVASCPG